MDSLEQFYQQRKGKFVVSFRGTDSFTDISESLVTFRNKELSQIESAEKLLEELPDEVEKTDVMLTGPFIRRSYSSKNWCDSKL